MVIIQIQTALKNGYHLIQSQSHREKCWLDGWIAVPPEWEARAMACGGYCELTIENGVLMDIIPLPIPDSPPPEPTAEEDRDALLVDLDYRMTLVELGVM